jgi:DNA polymerase-3 subunit epsilon
MSLARTGDPYGPWWQHDFVVFDVETTGFGEGHRVVEVGFARFERCQLAETWGSLIDPGREIPADATAVHGITQADVQGAPPFIKILGDMLRITRKAQPAAYNEPFDRSFWAEEMRQLDLGNLQTPMFDSQVRWLDPLTWIRHLDKIPSGNSLAIACERHGIPMASAHRAVGDATAAGLLLLGPVRERLPPMTVTEMLRRQAYLQDEQAFRR